MTVMLCAGCATNGVENSYCSIAKPIYITQGDELTDDTAREILDHDEVGAKLCGWK